MLLSRDELEMKEFLRTHGLAQFPNPLLSGGATDISQVQTSSRDLFKK